MAGRVTQEVDGGLLFYTVQDKSVCPVIAYCWTPINENNKFDFFFLRKLKGSHFVVALLLFVFANHRHHLAVKRLFFFVFLCQLM